MESTYKDDIESFIKFLQRHSELPKYLKQFLEMYLLYHGMSELDYVLNHSNGVVILKPRQDGIIQGRLFGDKPIHFDKDEEIKMTGRRPILLRQNYEDEIKAQIWSNDPDEVIYGKILEKFKVDSHIYADSQGTFTEFINTSGYFKERLSIEIEMRKTEQWLETYKSTIGSESGGSDYNTFHSYAKTLSSPGTNDKFLKYCDEIINTENFKKLDIIRKLKFPIFANFIRNLLIIEEDSGIL